MTSIELKIGDVVTIGDVEIMVVSIGYTVHLDIGGPGGDAAIIREKVKSKIPTEKPLKIDGDTLRLLDAAIVYQTTEPGSAEEIEAWASRLADDVKDAGD